MNTQPTTLFWAISLQTHTPHGVRVTSDRGVITPGPTTGQTRSELYTTVINEVCERRGLSAADTAVTFWSLEPNDV